jgi:hypothetical protein
MSDSDDVEFEAAASDRESVRRRAEAVKRDAEAIRRDAEAVTGPHDSASIRRDANALTRDVSAVRRDAEAVRREAEVVRAFADRRNPFWPAQVTVLAAIALDLGLPDKLTIGPRWVLPAVEALLVLGLLIASPQPNFKHSALRRQIAMSLIGLVSAVNLFSLIELVRYLLRGGQAGGRTLIIAGVVLWWTNVLLFGLWYWELDRGGPMRRIMVRDALPDFLFPQMTQKRIAPPGWRPNLVDYLYVSFTNATAFSPTETMPLTQMAKILMTVQSFASLVTVGLVVSRAVNILA